MERSCSFCGIEESRTDRLLLGPDCAICNACVESCVGQLDPLYPGVPDPKSLADAIARNMKWGEINSGAGVRANFCCEYCNKPMLGSLDSYYSWEIDHVIPGGGDALDNSALACRTCNHLKHTFMPTGNTREERISDARREIDRRRSEKVAELQKLREVVGLPPLIRA